MNTKMSFADFVSRFGNIPLVGWQVQMLSLIEKNPKDVIETLRIDGYISQRRNYQYKKWMTTLYILKESWKLGNSTELHSSFYDPVDRKKPIIIFDDVLTK